MKPVHLMGIRKKQKRYFTKLNEELETLQELLYVEYKHKVLIVLQGMDTSGKDGVIRGVLKASTPRV